jgi:GlpG protein
VIPAIEFSPQQADLTGFSGYLQNLQFPHRFSEHEGKIVLWVFEQQHVEIAGELYRRFRLLPEQAHILPAKNSRLRIPVAAIARYPVTYGLIIFSVAGFFIVALQLLDWLSFASFQGFSVVGDELYIQPAEQVMQKIISGELWRLLTPAFLHFDIMHLVFNLTMTWFLGNQIEKKEGSLKLLAYVVVMAVISNVSQFYYAPDHLFGGMSGINYGFLGYCGVVNYRNRKSCFNLPVGFFMVSVIAMLLGFFNFFAIFGYNIANWAHLAGFVAGTMIAAFSKLEDKVVF